MQTLTLCMIVRDEEAILPQFLAAATGLWDELCVVDTGSIDNTTNIIRMAGGRVQSVLWNDDFSEARNVSLEMASSDWVIVLDADELVSPTLIQSARAQLERRDRGACVLPFVSEREDGTIHRTNYLRMFRRHPALRYTYRLHEDITGVTERYLTARQLGVGRLSGHVEHLGDRPERQVMRGIRRRDEVLCNLTLRDDPNDLQGWYERLRHVARWQGAHAAAALVPACLEKLHAAVTQTAAGEDSLPCRLLLASATFLAGRSVETAVKLLDAWEPRVAAFGQFYTTRAELLVQADRPAAAATDFCAALTLSHTSLDANEACVRPLVGLALLHHRQADREEAQDLVTRALSFDARDPLALDALAQVSTPPVDGSAGLSRAVADYIARYGDCPERQAIFDRYDTLQNRS